MEDRLRLRAPSYHVEVNGRLDARGQLRPAVEQRHRPLDLRRPDESNGAARRRDALLVDQLVKRPGNCQDGGAAAGVVVRSRPRMIEVTTEDDLLIANGGIDAGNG